MIEMGKKYQTRDGRAVRILAVDLKGQPYGVPVCAAITEHNGKETLFLYDENGRYNINHEPVEDERNLDSDLVPVPTKHGGWCLVDTDAPSYATREEAERAFTTGVYAVWNPCDDRYQIVHVTWED